MTLDNGMDRLTVEREDLKKGMIVMTSYGLGVVVRIFNDTVLILDDDDHEREVWIEDILEIVDES